MAKLTFSDVKRLERAFAGGVRHGMAHPDEASPTRRGADRTDAVAGAYDLGITLGQCLAHGEMELREPKDA